MTKKENTQKENKTATKENTQKENKMATKEKVNYNDIVVENGNFKFSFTIGEIFYECTFKSTLKGIASEKWVINNEVHKVGIKKGCSLIGRNDLEENIRLKRKNVLKSIRGDDSDEKRLAFEIEEIDSKVKTFEEKIEKLKSLKNEKRKELDSLVEFKKENDIDVEALKEKSKKEKVETLKKQLQELQG